MILNFPNIENLGVVCDCVCKQIASSQVYLQVCLENIQYTKRTIFPASLERLNTVYVSIYSWNWGKTLKNTLSHWKIHTHSVTHIQTVLQRKLQKIDFLASGLFSHIIFFIFFFHFVVVFVVTFFLLYIFFFPHNVRKMNFSFLSIL